MPRQCPRRAGAECQPGTSCLRRQEHQMRQMAHKSWRCVRGVDGRPSSGEHAASRWAEGASARQHQPRTHYRSLPGVTEAGAGGGEHGEAFSTVSHFQSARVSTFEGATSYCARSCTLWEIRDVQTDSVKVANVLWVSLAAGTIWQRSHLTHRARSL